jgi:hypothetical protein
MRLLATIKFSRKTASYTIKYRILKVTFCSWKEPDAQDQIIRYIINFDFLCIQVILEYIAE